MSKQTLKLLSNSPCGTAALESGTAGLWHYRTRIAALPHLQTTSNHSSKSMNENLDRKNFLAYCRYDNHRSRARSGRNTTDM